MYKKVISQFDENSTTQFSEYIWNYLINESLSDNENEGLGELLAITISKGDISLASNFANKLIINLINSNYEDTMYSAFGLALTSAIPILDQETVYQLADKLFQELIKSGAISNQYTALGECLVVVIKKLDSARSTEIADEIFGELLNSAHSDDQISQLRSSYKSAFLNVDKADAEKITKAALIELEIADNKDQIELLREAMLIVSNKSTENSLEMVVHLVEYLAPSYHWSDDMFERLNHKISLLNHLDVDRLFDMLLGKLDDTFTHSYEPLRQIYLPILNVNNEELLNEFSIRIFR